MNFSLSDLLSFLPDSWNSWDLSDEATREFLTLLGVRLSLLAICVCVSLLLGRIVPSLLRSLGARAVPDERRKQYDDFVGPLVDTAKLTVSLILVDVSLNVIRNYEGPFVVLKFIADLAATISIAWLFSKAARQFIRIYGINLIRRVSPDVNELILVLQTTVNVFIGFFAVAIFAQSRDVNLAALLAGFGIGGIAVAFAAQETLGQVLATIVLYLVISRSPLCPRRIRSC